MLTPGALARSPRLCWGNAAIKGAMPWSDDEPGWGGSSPSSLAGDVGFEVVSRRSVDKVEAGTDDGAGSKPVVPVHAGQNAGLAELSHS